MTYNVNTKQELLDLDGEPIKGGKDGTNLQLRDAIRLCCEQDPRGELDGDKKLKAARLAVLALSADTVDMTDADFILLRERSGSICGPVLHLRICEIIDYYTARADATKDEVEVPKAETNGAGEVDPALVGSEN